MTDLTSRQRTPEQIADAVDRLIESSDQEWYDDADESDYDYVGPLERDAWLALREAAG
jgi:hypothetical protein